MRKDKKNNNKKIETKINKKGQTNFEKEEIGEIEDSTKYGEFISSYFGWMTLEEQKEKAKKMEEL